MAGDLTPRECLAAGYTKHVHKDTCRRAGKSSPGPHWFVRTAAVDNEAIFLYTRCFGLKATPERLKPCRVPITIWRSDDLTSAAQKGPLRGPFAFQGASHDPNRTIQEQASNGKKG
jgi:hypothetical protein